MEVTSSDDSSLDIFDVEELCRLLNERQQKKCACMRSKVGILCNIEMTRAAFHKYSRLVSCAIGYNAV